MNNPSSSRKQRQRGSALVEFAISWSVLFALMAGVYQFGYSFYVYNQLMTSVADAAVLGSKMDYDTGNTSLYTTALQNMVLYGSTVAGTSPLVPGLTASNVTITMAPAGSTVPSDVTISITGYQIDALFTKFTFNGKPRATFAYMGHVVCASC